jgi:uncharacterized protein (DUF779 family)
MATKRVEATPAALEIIEKLKAENGALIFHQSGGCCDGSAPMCFPKGEFMVGSRDVRVGEIGGCEFFMAPDQFEYVKNMHMTIDITEGRGSSFSLEIPLGIRFISISRLYTDEEFADLEPIV